MSNPVVDEIVRDLLIGRLAPDDAVHALSRLAGDAMGARRMVAEYDGLSEALDGMVAVIEEFRGISGQSGAELDRLLMMARRRSSILLSATLSEPLPSDGDTGTLASSSVRRLKSRLSRLGDAVAELVESAIRDSHLRKELEIAGTVQRMLVPSAQVTVGGLTAHAWYRGAEQCSGDWWTLAPAGGDALLVVGDVTGHGAPAAIVVGMIKGALDMALLGMGQTLRPYMVLNLLNHVLMDSVDREYFMTAVVARYDAQTRVLSIGNAGHRPPWVLSASGSRATKGNRQPPLGSTRGQRYVDDELKLEPGDRLIAFTDGLIEARSPDGREFGERTLRAVCEAAQGGGSQGICGAVQRAVETHVGPDRAFTDDVTFVVFEAT